METYKIEFEFTDRIREDGPKGKIHSAEGWMSRVTLSDSGGCCKSKFPKEPDTSSLSKAGKTTLFRSHSLFESCCCLSLWLSSDHAWIQQRCKTWQGKCMQSMHAAMSPCVVPLKGKRFSSNSTVFGAPLADALINIPIEKLWIKYDEQAGSLHLQLPSIVK